MSLFPSLRFVDVAYKVIANEYLKVKGDKIEVRRKRIGQINGGKRKLRGLYPIRRYCLEEKTLRIRSVLVFYAASASS